jgi:hypothetical protein
MVACLTYWRDKMDWIQLLVLMGTMLGTVLGIVIPLHLHTLVQLKAIADEMKDFHGRLCAIEERNSARLMK